jgi:hypothetical protein
MYIFALYKGVYLINVFLGVIATGWDICLATGDASVLLLLYDAGIVQVTSILRCGGTNI